MKQNKIIEKNFSVIVLAAGKSLRMGMSKSFLKFNEQETFIEHIVNEYLDFGCKQVVIVTNNTDIKWFIKNVHKFPENNRIIINHHPEWHRFYSLKTGAKRLKNVHPVFVHNVDNPFVNQDVLNKLSKTINKADYISPEIDGKGGHPFLISENIIHDLRSIQEDQIHLKEFLNQYPKMKVQVEDEKVLVNINTIDEYRKYF